MTCGEVFRLRVPLPDMVAVQTRQPNLGAPTRPRCAADGEALRMRPSRIVAGAVRREECLDLTQSSSGFPRFLLLCHVHAPSGHAPGAAGWSSGQEPL